MWACLLHGSAPGWFTDDARAGWTTRPPASPGPATSTGWPEAVGDLVAGWVPIHEPDLTARLGYLDGTFPPGRRREDDHHDAQAALRAAEAEAARLLRSGPRPVAVSWRPGDDVDHDDLVVVSAPSTRWRTRWPAWPTPRRPRACWS